MTTLLIDGDIIAYTVAARVEQKIQWDENTKTRQADIADARRECVQWIAELRERLKADAVIVALSDPSGRYFRHDFYPQYKAHRTSGEKPLVLSATKAFLSEHQAFKPYTRPTLEADDVLGILATHPTLVGGDRIIVTSDKDLNQVPGLHYNPRHPERGVVLVNQAEADEFFYTQVLTGDPTDGFPGCPKIGPVKAKKILELADSDTSDFWQAIVATYAAKGLDEQYALTQARVARILRWYDYDYSNKKAILWTPELPKTTSETASLPSSSASSPQR